MKSRFLKICGHVKKNHYIVVKKIKTTKCSGFWHSIKRAKIQAFREMVGLFMKKGFKGRSLIL